MDDMTDPSLPSGQLPPIPDGCGVMPIAENKFAPHPGPPSFPPEAAPISVDPGSEPPILNDALEMTYRRVLARALALAACALLFASITAASLIHNSLPQGFVTAQLVFHTILIVQLFFMSFFSRYVEKLSIAPAAVLLFAYAAFCALEFSALLSPAGLAVAFFCAALMFGATALWGFTRRADLARPITIALMLLFGGAALVAVNLLLRTRPSTWKLSSLAVIVFASLATYYAEQIRDFYQEFDDDNAEGWKASVLGALLLVVNSVNLYLLAATFLGRFLSDDGDRSDDLER
jgi:FtsH-binding integral membrane protein